MRRIGDSNTCPYCSSEKNDIQQAPFLPLKTVVAKKYLVGKLASHNSEGNTYYAFDLERKCPVTLNEFYPQDVISRGSDGYCLVKVGKASMFIDAKADFAKLWNTLKSIKGYSALCEVYDVFEDLGTVFAVSEYLGEGKTLRETLLEKEQGYVSWEEARVLLMPVLSGLSALHAAGVYHCGISPETLIVDKDGKVRLSGFSALLNNRCRGSRFEPELFDGYAAIEQYDEENRCGERADIYAFAAVLYRTLIGSTPIDAPSRKLNDKLMIPGKFAEKLPAYVINALVNALQILPDDRTRSVEILRDELSASIKAAVTAAEEYSDMASQKKTAAPPPMKRPTAEDGNDDGDGKPDSSKIKKSTIAALIISILLCAAILCTALFVLNKNGSGGNDASTEPLVTESADAAGTTEAPSGSKPTEAASDKLVKLSIPDFKGEKFDNIKADGKYKNVLTFETEYVDSKEERGTILEQDLPVGTNVTSMNRRTIKFTISDGLEVPDVIGDNYTEAIDKLEKAGFTNVNPEESKVADSYEKSYTVDLVVYHDTEKNDWAELPSDRRLSAGDKLFVYYYGEYSGAAPTTTAVPAETAAAAPAETVAPESAATP